MGDGVGDGEVGCCGAVAAGGVERRAVGAAVLPPRALVLPPWCFRRSVEFQWFLMALSVLWNINPGKSAGRGTGGGGSLKK